MHVHRARPMRQRIHMPCNISSQGQLEGVETVGKWKMFTPDEAAAIQHEPIVTAVQMPILSCWIL